MEAALGPADNLEQATVLAMHRALLSGQPGWDGHAGRYRDGLVWIGTSAGEPSVGSQGLMRSMPQPSKSREFRVASVRDWVWQIAAIMASMVGRGRPGSLVNSA